MKKDNIEFFDIVNEKDEVIDKISENMQLCSYAKQIEKRVKFLKDVCQYDIDKIEDIVRIFQMRKLITYPF